MVHYLLKELKISASNELFNYFGGGGLYFFFAELLYRLDSIDRNRCQRRLFYSLLIVHVFFLYQR